MPHGKRKPRRKKGKGKGKQRETERERKLRELRQELEAEQARFDRDRAQLEQAKAGGDLSEEARTLAAEIEEALSRREAKLANTRRALAALEVR